LSPRAACRLETLGFTNVYDYAAGKVDWLAQGLPVEGTHAELPTAGSLARHDAATCSLDESVGEVLRRIDASPYGFALVLGRGGVLIGRARRSALQSAEHGGNLESALEPGPSTIRPHLTVDELRDRLERSDVKTLVVTTPGGRLLGVVRRDEVPA
jgi:Mg/Co/Ni transporter MgtE